MPWALTGIDPLLLMKTDPSDAHANVLVHARPSFILLLRGVNQVLKICCSAEPCVALTKSTAAHGSAEQQIFLPCSVVSVELYESDQEVFVRQKEAMAFNRLP